MRDKLTNVLFVGLVVLISWSCTTSDPEPTPYESGVYVINAGNPSDNNGSLSYLNRTSNVASTDIFSAVNSRPLLGGVQDYTEINGKGVLLVNNSDVGKDKIELVESGTFKSLTTLTAPDVENPRYVVMTGPNKAYVSCWGTTGTSSNPYPNSGYILVVDLAARTVSKKIMVTKGPERMVVFGNKVFVGCVGGDPTLTIINTDTDEVQSTGLNLGANPSPIAIDAQHELWVYATATKEMIKLNPTSNAIDARLALSTSSAKSPGSITISSDKTIFYFVNYFYDAADNLRVKGETYRFSITDGTIQTAIPYINRYFTGLGIDPQTGILYAGVTPSYKQAGYVLRYRLNAATATLIDSVKTEIAPTKFYFR